MRQCELEKVVFEKRAKQATRSGQKLICFLDVDVDMQGAIVDLKKVEGLWVIDKVHEPDLDKNEIKRTWHVGGL